MRSITLDIQIYFEIKKYINKNELKTGDRLPSERELSEIFNVQRLTVREALKRLKNEGIVYSIRGSGNYIAEEKIQRNLSKFESLTNTIKKIGFNIKTKVIYIKEIESNKKLSNIMDVTLGTKVYEVKRLRFVKDIPLALETSYIPVRYAQGLNNCDLENKSLYETLENQYNIKLSSANQEIFMVFADKEESKLLGIGEGDALLMLKGTVLDSEGKKIEYSKSLTRGDRCVFTSELTR
ncbi:GntR family transcriptional regulator [Brassicibacter mesophilus]|uniref:GntR family transcriptional regulator n=1 Tax=Brassicibacter mesophilus TaxID=745119 RepID=UPI003D1B11FB